MMSNPSPIKASHVDPTLRAATKAFLHKISGKYDYADVILFGSSARLDHRPDSDMDVAVLLNGAPGEFVATKLAMDDLAYDVLLDTGIRITPLPIWTEEWAHPETYSNPALIANIQREGIWL